MGWGKAYPPPSRPKKYYLAKKYSQMQIVCPHCKTPFELSEAVSEEFKKDHELQLASEKERLRNEMIAFKRQKEDELRLKNEAFEQEKAGIEAAASQKVAAQYAAQLQSLQEERNQKAQQLQDFEKRQLDLLREKAALEQQQKNLELELEKRFLEKRKELEDSAIKREQEVFELKMKEKETQMESLKKTIEELRRKSEQGSMQLQGEAQELLLEELLAEHFPFDAIEEVGKGVEGADCIQTVRNGSGQECGKIIYESKRTKSWSNGWIEKLKADKRNRNADVAILVTQTFPKDMERFGEKEGVWVCGFNEVLGVAALVRSGIFRVFDAHKSQENRGDKMQLLYNYLTGNEFKSQVEAIAEGFMAMRQGIVKERVQMEKLWKEREKQLEKVLLSTSGMYGSVKGIAGASVGDIPLLDGEPQEPENEN
jgi:hypothetical protein